MSKHSRSAEIMRSPGKVLKLISDEGVLYANEHAHPGGDVIAVDPEENVGHMIEIDRIGGHIRCHDPELKSVPLHESPIDACETNYW